MSRHDDRHTPFTYGSDRKPRVRWWHRPMPGWLKLVLVLAVAGGGAAAYLHYVDPGLGRKLMGGTPLAPLAPQPKVTIAYKWRDAKGNWHLTDKPPPEGTPYEVLEARSDDNILPSISTTK